LCKPQATLQNKPPSDLEVKNKQGKKLGR